MTMIFLLDVTCYAVIWIVLGCLWWRPARTLDLFGAQDNDFGEIFTQICMPVKLVILVKTALLLIRVLICVHDVNRLENLVYMHFFIAKNLKNI